MRRATQHFKFLTIIAIAFPMTSHFLGHILDLFPGKTTTQHCPTEQETGFPSNSRYCPHKIYTKINRIDRSSLIELATETYRI